MKLNHLALIILVVGIFSVNRKFPVFITICYGQESQPEKLAHYRNPLKPASKRYAEDKYKKNREHVTYPPATPSIHFYDPNTNELINRLAPGQKFRYIISSMDSEVDNRSLDYFAGYRFPDGSTFHFTNPENPVSSNGIGSFDDPGIYYFSLRVQDSNNVSSAVSHGHLVVTSGIGLENPVIIKKMGIIDESYAKQIGLKCSPDGGFITFHDGKIYLITADAYASDKVVRTEPAKNTNCLRSLVLEIPSQNITDESDYNFSPSLFNGVIGQLARTYQQGDPGFPSVLIDDNEVTFGQGVNDWWPNFQAGWSGGFSIDGRLYITLTNWSFIDTLAQNPSIPGDNIMITDLYYFDNGIWYAAFDDSPDHFSGQKPLMPWIFYSWTSTNYAGITFPHFLFKDGSYNVDLNNDGEPDGYIYFIGGNHASHARVYLGRVPYGQQYVIDRGAYEYWNGTDWKPLNYQDNNGVWRSSEMVDACSVTVPHKDFPICNVTVSYNSYIDKYIMLIAEAVTFGNFNWGGNINMYVSDSITGPFHYVNTVIPNPWEVMNKGTLISHTQIETMSVLEWKEDGSVYLILQIFDSDPCDEQDFIFNDCGYGMYLVKGQWIHP